MTVTAIALAADYKKLQDLIESGEELTLEMIADTVEGIEGALGDKMDSLFSFVRNIDGLALTCDEEAKRLAARKKSFETQAKNIRLYILNCLLASGKDSLKTTYNTFSAAKGRSTVVIDDESKLPDELVDTTVVTAPNKKGILEAIENGIDIKGAHIEIGPRSLRVR